MAAGVGSITFDDDLAADGLGSEQVDDIFGEDDDIFNAPAPLPPLSPTNIDTADGGGDEADETSDDKKPKKKFVKRSPQPRLDDARLCSERGIPALANLCDGITFKGKGHEASDLNVLLQRFEHWAHRLFPKFPFQDCVDQIESMGSKKLVQNTIKSVRRGETGQVDSDEEFATIGDQDADDEQSAMNDANFGEQIRVETSNTPVPQLGLTPEQQERIRLNRERALAKRKQQQLKQATQELNSSSKPAEASQEPQSPEPTNLPFETDLEGENKDVSDVANEGTTRDDVKKTRESGDEPEKTIGQFREDLEMTSEARDESKETKRNSSQDGKEGTMELRKENVEDGTIQDESMETNDDEGNKNVHNDVDNEPMEIGMTLHEPNEVMNDKSNSGEKDDVALARSQTDPVENANDELLGNESDDGGMGTECAGKNKDLNMKDKINDISMET